MAIFTRFGSEVKITKYHERTGSVTIQWVSDNTRTKEVPIIDLREDTQFEILNAIDKAENVA